MGQPNLPADLEGRVKAFDAMLIAMSQQLPPTNPGISTEDVAVNDNVTVRLYHPPGADGKKLPLTVFAHGGGWIAGNLDTEDHICRVVCGEVNCIVMSVAYRLVPATSFPTPIDDVAAAFDYAHQNTSDLGACGVYLWGGSAGGALVLAVAYQLRRKNRISDLAGLVLMAPMFLHPDACPEKYKHLHRSWTELSGPIPLVTADDCMKSYHGFGLAPPYEGDDERRNWFPLTIGPEALKGMPRTYIINCEIECMRDDGTVAEAQMIDAGMDVKRVVLPGLPHYFWSFPLEKAGLRFRDTLVKGVKWMLELQS
ncbi:hypothetical protein LTR78_009257 [Recurvomyces mirabilis]|uniref:Alpha/beta hydrolase fold-3 domain-containing protein n=1 Tax=Recurvomyces mirabilis TaxID=574656 RepID=A0AAE0TNN5_9PEZI|nr:hypothetical protein LTR78_009257 [Recurvomyces mirabilis]KAK5156182.1 hypothetical protein LTS14_005069 [Recurvomyces mirabilis]